MDVEKLLSAIPGLFPNNPWMVTLTIVILGVGWKSPEILKVSLDHFRENKRINAEIDNQSRRVSVEIKEKLLKIENLRKRVQK